MPGCGSEGNVQFGARFSRPACKWILRILKFLIFNLQFGLLLVSAAHSQDRTQARSMVISRYGIVATEHPLASQIGVSILEQGGNAVDAAVAANAAMGVFAPMA